jgi:predicted transcriptional regulator
MRTTLTIDDGTDRKLKRLAHETGTSYKQVVNETLQAGLQASQVRERRKAYRVKPAALGEVSPGYDLDKALALADTLEDAETARKLKLRK